MSIQNVVIETVKCDNPACTHSATFPKAQTQEALNEIIGQNPWLKTGRGVQTADGRAFWYCTTVCEIEGIKLGQHELIEKKVIEMPTGPALEAIKAAAAQEAAKRAGTQALKDGQPVTLHQG